ncbi:OLC1v1035944C1 [Oldenlandia corymbosa var. corymbosa]|uniref:OLC1v1035944C1 n=1 Tax=Oldenlandia corymbosa var. corymbosa TaxID=529605 RepID=A0AAV1CXB1_OLDCO|nr:OLC1v1035944C1 [Oldenlandia corymbosa var. corymbosa]
MNSNQIEVESGTLKIFTRALIKEQKYEEALDFLRNSVGKTQVLNQTRIFDDLIQGYSRNKNDPEKGLMVLRDALGLDGIVPSSFTFCSLIYGFSSQGKMDRVIEVLELMTSGKCSYPFDNFVCSSVINGFLRIGKPELAIEFYENAVSSDALKANVVTYTVLLSAYFMLGRIDQVSYMVSRMYKDGLSFDVVFYSSWICGYFREGMVEEAFRKYGEMLGRKTKMDTVAYTVLIDGISKDGNVEKTAGLFSRMLKSGLKPNIVTFTALMLGFCRKGKLQEALALFKMIGGFGIEVDEFSYAVLIDGFCRRADFDAVFQLLDEMDMDGIKPSVVTYNIVINGLCKAGRISDANDFSKGIVGDIFTYSTLLHGYVTEGNTAGMVEMKKRFEAAGIGMDIVMCNVLIKALFMMGLFEDAYAIYKGMPEMGLTATSITYCTMVHGYSKEGRFYEAFEILDDIQGPSEPIASCYESIINGLCQKDMIDMAIEVFLELVARGLPLKKILYRRLFNMTYNAKGASGVYSLIDRMKDIDSEAFGKLGNYAISFLCQKNYSTIILDLLLLMITNKSFVISESYFLILKNLLRDGESMFARIILNMYLKQYGIAESRVIKVIINFLCLKDVKSALKFIKNLNQNSSGTISVVAVLQTLQRYGRTLEAYELLREAKKDLLDTDLLIYSSIIIDLCKEGHLDKALELCGSDRAKSICLNIASYNAIMNELLHQGCLVEALRLFDSMVKINKLPSETMFAMLINSLSKEGRLADARMMLDDMSDNNVKPNIRIYNSLIYGYCKFGQMQKALQLIRDLDAVDIKPDQFTKSIIIYGYCQRGDIEGALEFFSEFKSKDISPDFLGFMYLIRGLIAKGRMEESQSILRQMLQSQSVIDILSGLDTGNEMDSVHRFLVSLCERGSIQEAVSILDEVGAVCFPVRRRFGGTDIHEKQELPDMNLEETSKSDILNFSFDASTPAVCNDDKTLETICKPTDEKVSKSQNFDSSYAYVASLCAKGEISKANELVNMISGFLGSSISSYCTLNMLPEQLLFGLLLDRCRNDVDDDGSAFADLTWIIMEPVWLLQLNIIWILAEDLSACANVGEICSSQQQQRMVDICAHFRVLLVSEVIDSGSAYIFLFPDDSDPADGAIGLTQYHGACNLRLLLSSLQLE